MKINLTVAFIVFFAINYNSNAIDVEQTNKRNMQGVYEFVKSCGHYFIATVEKGTSDTVTTGAVTIIKEKDIQPRLRPFGTVAIFDGKLYIQTGKKKRVSLQMHDNPKIEICALNEQKNEWIRIEAVAVNDERLEAKKYMLEQYPELKGIYSAEDDNTQVLWLKNATATFYSFTGEEEMVKFGWQ